jgi:serine/threonine protein kinase
MERYEVAYKLGSGTYGTVYKGVDLETGSDVAIKKIRNNSKGDGVDPCTLREVALLKHLGCHPNIISLLECVIQPTRILIVLECMQKDLHAVIYEKKGSLPLGRIKNFLYQLLCGLAFMHAAGVLHRDVKPKNCLVSGDRLKICDLGMARASMAANLNTRALTHEVVTLWYRAPGGYFSFTKPV